MHAFIRWSEAHARASDAEHTLHGRMRAGELPEHVDLAHTALLRAEASELLVAMLVQMHEVAQMLRHHRGRGRYASVQRLAAMPRAETHDRFT